MGCGLGISAGKTSTEEDMFFRSVGTAAFLSIVAFSVTPASAGGWPASIAGNWSVTANNQTGTLVNRHCIYQDARCGGAK